MELWRDWGDLGVWGFGKVVDWGRLGIGWCGLCGLDGVDCVWADGGVIGGERMELCKDWGELGDWGIWGDWGFGRIWGDFGVCSVSVVTYR